MFNEEGSESEFDKESGEKEGDAYEKVFDGESDDKDGDERVFE